MSKELKIKVTDKQYDLLRRIAISDRYKLNDLICLIFARGLILWYTLLTSQSRVTLSELSVSVKHIHSKCVFIRFKKFCTPMRLFGCTLGTLFRITLFGALLSQMLSDSNSLKLDLQTLWLCNFLA